MSSELPAPTSRVTVREITHLQAAEIDDLCAVLIACVNDGASIGFHAPLLPEIARAWWERLPRPGVTLLVAEADGRIGGTVQLHAAESANGAHRAEVAKLLVHPAWRRQGIARELMYAAESVARRLGKLLIVLDTREGDPSNLLYASVGYKEGGRIPDWARDAAGDLSATIFWYKQLT
jgi:GNAT superfamily N-acetyltransferase